MASLCPSCGVRFRSEDYSSDTRSVQCFTCGSLFSVPLIGQDPRLREVVQPKMRWVSERQGDMLRLTRRWYTPGIWCIALMFLPAVVGLVGSFTPLIPAQHRTEARRVGAGLLLLGYPVLVCFFNRTLIEVSPSTGLKVRHGPLPWFYFSRTVAAHDCRQFYGRRLKHPTDNNKTAYAFELYVHKSSGTNHMLVGGNLTPQEVLFLERSIEDHLGIKDALMAEEFKNSSDGYVSPP